MKCLQTAQGKRKYSVSKTGTASLFLSTVFQVLYWWSAILTMCLADKSNTNSYFAITQLGTEVAGLPLQNYYQMIFHMTIRQTVVNKPSCKLLAYNNCGVNG